MNRIDFENRLRFFKVGDCMRLTCRGNYGNFVEIGRLLVKSEDGRIYLDKGFSHSYRRIKCIDFCTTAEEKLVE